MTNPLSPKHYTQITQPYISSSPDVSPSKKSMYQSPNKVYHEIQSDLTRDVIIGIMNNLEEAYKGFYFNEHVFNALYEETSTRKGWVFRGNGLTAPNLYIGPGKIYVEDGLISKTGGENRVTSIIEVNLTQNIPNKSRVIKIPLQHTYSKHSPFSPEKNLITTIQNNDPNAVRRLDAVIDKHMVEIDRKHYHCGVYKKSSMDFGELDLTKFSPLLLWRLVDIAKALREMHKNGVVHNDLKDGNFLFDGYDKVAKLTDFGCMKKIEDNAEPHNTSGTPFFADPFIWKNWRAQLEAFGNQKHPSCDIRSFGKWLLYGFLHKKLDLRSNSILGDGTEPFGNCGNLFEEVKGLKLKITPIEKQFNLTSDRQAIDDLDNNHPGQVIFYRTNYFNQKVYALHFPEVKECLQLTLEWIELIKDKMSDIELEAMRSIAELACKMQSPIHELPTMDQIVESLSKIAGDPEDDIAGSPYKRKCSKRNAIEEIPEEPPLSKKLKLDTMSIRNRYSTEHVFLSKRKLEFPF